MNNDTQNIIPEAANLFYALRDSGYSNIAALEDIMDNSIDAKAKNVRVFIDNLDKIIIADDGIGMSPETLVRAIRLGGRKKHDNTEDLGKYGFGLITASISMGRKVTVITRQDGQTHTAIFDYDEVRETNQFNATFRDATESEIVSFDYRTEKAESGTVVIIDNCDKMQYSTAKKLADELKDSASEVFYPFLQTGKSIVINGNELRPQDPLCLGKQTKVWLDKTIKIKNNNPEGETSRLHIRAVTIPEFLQEEGVRYANITHQGFYILRNNREIAAAKELPDIFKKHNDYNLLRIELRFEADLDGEMGINYTKHEVKPSDRIINALKNELGDIVTAVRKEAKKRQEENRKKREQAKNPFTASVDTSVATPAPKITTPTSKPHPTVPAKAELAVEEVKIGVRFKDENAALFEVSIQPGKADVWYNGANSFYAANIIGGTDGAKVKDCLDSILTNLIKSQSQHNIPADLIVQTCNDIAAGLVRKEV